MAVQGQSFVGYLYDGQSAERAQIVLRVSRQGLQLERDGAPPLLWPWGQVRQTSGRYPGQPVRLEHGEEPAAAVVVDDDAFVPALRRLAPGETAHIRGGSSNAGRIASVLGALVLSAGLGAALYLWGIPGFASFVAAHVPLSWEEKLGEEAFAAFTADVERCEDKAAQAALDTLLARLDAAAQPHPYRLRVAIVIDGEVNAFALPGGRLVVNSGLLEVMRTPSEVAGVLAHEVQHVLLRHSTRALLRDASLSLLVGALVGDAGAATSAFEAARQLGGLRYSRDAEREADASGMQLIQAARLEAAGMVRSFEALRDAAPGEVPTVLSALSTHPDTEERIRLLQRRAASATYAPVDLGGPEAWRVALAGCL